VPVHRGQNQADITNAVCDVLARLVVDLVLVDEIHNLNLATRAGADASDQLKYLAERFPATFIYAGVNTEGSGLFAGTRGQQIASRFGSTSPRELPGALPPMASGGMGSSTTRSSSTFWRLRG
jgi:hypothetical protein